MTITLSPFWLLLFWFAATVAAGAATWAALGYLAFLFMVTSDFWSALLLWASRLAPWVVMYFVLSYGSQFF